MKPFFDCKSVIYERHQIIGDPHARDDEPLGPFGKLFSSGDKDRQRNGEQEDPSEHPERRVPLLLRLHGFEAAVGIRLRICRGGRRLPGEIAAVGAGVGEIFRAAAGADLRLFARFHAACGALFALIENGAAVVAPMLELVCAAGGADFCGIVVFRFAVRADFHVPQSPFPFRCFLIRRQILRIFSRSARLL